MPRRTRVRPFDPNQARNDSYPEKTTYCVKYTMFFMNVLFWIVSCLILAIGIYAMNMKKELYGKISGLTTDPAVILVCIGVVMFAICFAGCLGALRENICLLRFFAAMLGLMLILEITAAVIGYVYYGRVKAEVKQAFDKMIVRYRDDPDLQLIIDSVQRELECCGSETYRDWEKNEYFNCSSPSIERCGVPFSCCATKDINSQCGFGMLLVSEQQAKESIYIRGCLDGVESWLKSNMILMVSIAASCPFLQLTGFCLARRLTNDIKDVLAQRH